MARLEQLDFIQVGLSCLSLFRSENKHQTTWEDPPVRTKSLASTAPASAPLKPFQRSVQVPWPVLIWSWPSARSAPRAWTRRAKLGGDDLIGYGEKAGPIWVAKARCTLRGEGTE